MLQAPLEITVLLSSFRGRVLVLDFFSLSRQSGSKAVFVSARSNLRGVVGHVLSVRACVAVSIPLSAQEKV